MVALACGGCFVSGGETYQTLVVHPGALHIGVNVFVQLSLGFARRFGFLSHGATNKIRLPRSVSSLLGVEPQALAARGSLRAPLGGSRRALVR